MHNSFFGSMAALVVMAGAAVAQQGQFYIQVEARPTLDAAQARVQVYAADLPNVNGFFLGQGWYAIALGPYSSADAAQDELRNLRRITEIPDDAYIETAQYYGRQFWPVGADIQSEQLVPVRRHPLLEEQIAIDPQKEMASHAPETPAEARRSESLLTRTEREQLQIALNWAGVYMSGIDGAFGPGTRRAMSAWQERQGYDSTGVLTTGQRAELLGQFNAVLEGLDFATYSDAATGIEMDIPLGAVEFARHDAPLAIFEPTGFVPEAMVLFISQAGDTTTLSGLYEIMQTLQIVPVTGERSRRSSGFILTGENDRIVSHTEVTLERGEIKGFTLVWPSGDEERRKRVLARMKSSFTRLNGVLEASAAPQQSGNRDLVSGLQVRKPIRDGSGFFVDQAGLVMTSGALVEQCDRVTLNHEYDVDIVYRAAPGLALLKPVDSLAPRRIAAFSQGAVNYGAAVATAGFSYGGALSAATLNFGTMQDPEGLNGEDNLARLAVNIEDGDVGGPVLDSAGGVVGMVLPADLYPERRLPDGVVLTVSADEITTFLSGQNVSYETQQPAAAIDPEDLTSQAGDMTVLVSCWG